jgi:DNA modification methylase
MAFIILQGDANHIPLRDESVQCVVTSPPYWGLRAYLPDADPLKRHELGLEPVHDCLGWATGNPCGECYVCHMVAVFREVKRVLRKDGVVWLNLGDSYATGAGKVGDHPGGGAQGERWAGPTTQPNRMPIAGLKPKDLVGIPWRVAFALQADGWWVRSDIIWAKPNPIPESVTDRPTKAHEYVFLLAKSKTYFYDADAIREPHKPASLSRYEYGHNAPVDPTGMVAAASRTGAFQCARMGDFVNPLGRNRRTVWTVPTHPFPDAHFATFPPALVEPCIKAGTSEKGCCPKCGAPWERVVERESERHNAGAAKQRIVASGGALDGGTERSTLGGMTRFVQREEVGWQPTCDCNAGEPVPCIVLDPFSGAGTTALVADRLGRNGVGLDLSGTYTRMGRDRVFNDAPLLALMGV